MVQLEQKASQPLPNTYKAFDKPQFYLAHIRLSRIFFYINEYYNDGEAPERSVDVEIAIQLKEENKAFKVEKIQLQMD